MIELPKLPYKRDALEPHIKQAQTEAFGWKMRQSVLKKYMRTCLFRTLRKACKW